MISLDKTHHTTVFPNQITYGNFKSENYFEIEILLHEINN
jgi:hypothetical protein